MFDKTAEWETMSDCLLARVTEGESRPGSGPRSSQEEPTQASPSHGGTQKVWVGLSPPLTSQCGGRGDKTWQPFLLGSLGTNEEQLCLKGGPFRKEAAV